METLKVGTAARLAPSDLAAAVIAPLIGLPGSSPHTTAFFNRRFERLDPCRERQAAILAGDPIGEDDGALDDHDRRAPAHPAICRPANSCVATLWGRAACAVPDRTRVGLGKRVSYRVDI